ncbi:hypothetical protein BR63_15730 [Thermanaerosceptrum fracticalcis]|uniref:Uncharacterized protein n=1 Tax=Thermanaerosceptrum fracticalcis TaxID=1712410 RepID=A0A7G6E692_THEFR|nr:hypothetical protein [Thermanaerosceptrum fracticalcis]QNB47596.1 hypothetical protein BR63_15730 [Thermanaerosceptrum fracticalcis]
MAAESLIRPIFFILLTLSMLILVPRERIYALTFFGLTAGVLLAVVIQIIAVHILKLWYFNYLVPLWDFFNLPTFIILSWGVAEILFAHLLPRNSIIMAFLFILAFSLGSTLVEWFFNKKNLIIFLRWQALLTFFLALFIHIPLGYYLIQKDKLIKNIHIRRKT